MPERTTATAPGRCRRTIRRRSRSRRPRPMSGRWCSMSPRAGPTPTAAPEAASIADNVEAYAPGSPIFALSGDDHLTGSSGNDLFVFAQPIGNDTIYNFDAAHDQIDLIGFDGLHQLRRRPGASGRRRQRQRGDHARRPARSITLAWRRRSHRSPRTTSCSIKRRSPTTPATW